MLKLIIFLLFVAVVVSLFSGLNFLVKDLGNRRKRLLYALGVRVGLVAILLATVAYGVASGQLRSTAPWDQQLRPEASVPTGQR